MVLPTASTALSASGIGIIDAEIADSDADPSPKDKALVCAESYAWLLKNRGSREGDGVDDDGVDALVGGMLRVAGLTR